MSVDWAAEHELVAHRHDADVRAVGLGDVWDHLLSRDHSAARGILIGSIGALGTFLRETGYAPPKSPAA